MNESCRPFLVLGLGNELLGDDAVGIHIVRQLQARLPQEVECIVSALSGFALLDFLVGRRKVAIVDCYIPREGMADEILELRPQDWEITPAPCPHYAGIGELHQWMQALQPDFPAELRIFCVPVCDSATVREGLTEEVAARLAETVEAIERAIRSWFRECSQIECHSARSAIRRK